MFAATFRTPGDLGNKPFGSPIRQRENGTCALARAARVQVAVHLSHHAVPGVGLEY